ncbi:MAG: hypothetical protein COT74_05490 [Bdellovibrionales bacterium CG10_big_fil_rev_8_21_14_0_10_45_34]|nr:MAG: hypothetical protein COT74_05490 [Bdellovibrionales bacterium CG10_big_fil_rev_8_21_14_0_10_45_34]
MVRAEKNLRYKQCAVDATREARAELVSVTFFTNWLSAVMRGRLPSRRGVDSAVTHWLQAKGAARIPGGDSHCGRHGN